MTSWAPCSHHWIDLEEPPIQRASYSPVIGPKRREMKHGRVYRCNNCEAVLRTPSAPPLSGDHGATNDE
jgi:hypothetical protein